MAKKMILMRKYGSVTLLVYRKEILSARPGLRIQGKELDDKS